MEDGSAEAFRFDEYEKLRSSAAEIKEEAGWEGGCQARTGEEEVSIK